MSQVSIFSDGSSLGNPGPGGYGVIMRWKNQEIKISQGYRETTNNRMELLGPIVALSKLKKPEEVVITTDSRYVIDGIDKGWAKKWKKNNWKTASKKDVKNRELWIRLDEAIKDKNISWVWVKGHAGNAGNEQADYLARSALEKL